MPQVTRTPRSGMGFPVSFVGSPPSHNAALPPIVSYVMDYRAVWAVQGALKDYVKRFTSDLAEYGVLHLKPRNSNHVLLVYVACCEVRHLQECIVARAEMVFVVQMRHR